MRITAVKMVAALSLAAAPVGLTTAGAFAAHHPASGARHSVAALHSAPSVKSAVSHSNDPWD